MARKILLADDSVTAQSMGRRILTDAGYEVTTVSNGSAALKKIAESRPDLIVLDVYMPGYGGLEVCQRLKETRETSRIPVLLSVGKLEPFKPEEARRVRADAYIVKPFEASELLTALTKLEDKIVPQPEPYKQGRFAKAVAAVDQFSNAEMGESEEGFGDSETGWKDRLIIPTPGARATEAETEAHHGADTGFRNLARDEDFKPAEPKQGFERPMPAGLPADISAEEIAAITAAAAAISGRGEEPAVEPQTPVAEAAAEPPAATREETPSEPPASVTPEPQAEPAPSGVEELKVEPPAEAAASEEPVATFASAPEAQPEAAPETTSEVAHEAAPAEPAVDIPAPEPAVSSAAEPANEIPAAPVEAEPISAPEPAVAEVAKPAAADADVLAALAALAPVNGDDAGSQDGRGLVSVAAALTSAELEAVSAGIAGPRWIAEAVPVDEQESTFLLEQEMEKAYAAMAAAEAAQTMAAARAAEMATAIPEASLPAQRAYTPPEFSSMATPALEVPAPATAAEPAASLPPEPTPAAFAEAAGESPSSPEIATPAVAQAANETAAAPEEEVALAAAASASSGPVEALPEAQTVSLPAPADSSHSAIQEFQEAERQRESELAAAWASWKPGHESKAESSAAAQIAGADAGFDRVSKEEAPSPEPKPAPEAEAAAPAADDAGEISEIVDDMLAELKPKLMAEISKKLKKGKNKK